MEKKSGNNLIWWLLAGAGVFFFLKRRSALINYESPSVPFQKLTTSGIELDIVLPIINGSGFGVTVQNFIGNVLDSSGSVLAYVALSNPTALPPIGRTELKFRTTITWGSLALEIVDIIKAQGKVDIKNYRIKGVLVISGGIRIPIDQPLL